MTMIKKFFAITLLLLFISPACQQGKGLSPEEYRRKAVLQMRAACDGRGISRGSGILIRYRGHDLVLTAAHVVMHSSFVWIINDKNELSPIRIRRVILPGFHDVAILIVDHVPANHPRVQLYTGDIPPAGSRLIAMGYEQGDKFKEMTCILKAILRGPIGGDTGVGVLTDADLIPGMSGGPLFWNGKVIALHTSIARAPNGEKIALHAYIKSTIKLLDEVIEEF